MGGSVSLAGSWCWQEVVQLIKSPHPHFLIVQSGGTQPSNRDVYCPKIDQSDTTQLQSVKIEFCAVTHYHCAVIYCKNINITSQKCNCTC